MQSKAQSYDALARYYDLAHATYRDDLPLWLTLAAETVGPVLELGAGTGRVTLPLAQAGHTVTAIEASAAMLAIAQAKAAQKPRDASRITWLHGDMRSTEPDAQFGLALLPYNTFMHLATTTAQFSLLQQLKQALAPGGLLAFDIANPFPLYAAQPNGISLEQVFDDPDNNTVVQQFAIQQLDHVAQINTVLWQFDATDTSGRLSRTSVRLHYRLTFPSEMALLLHASGFKLRHLTGDFNLETPFETHSPVMVVVAEAQ